MFQHTEDFASDSVDGVSSFLTGVIRVQVRNFEVFTIMSFSLNDLSHRLGSDTILVLQSFTFLT